jgi:hypothetical protein
MSKLKGPPKGEPWIWKTRALMKSAAWRGLGINARRVVDFLECEHMGHGGKENGLLVAPRKQLIAWGIGARHISGAIREMETSGLVDVERSAGRRPNRYTLNWLPMHDGSTPAQRWRTVSEGKSLRRGQQYLKGSRSGAANGIQREVVADGEEGQSSATASEGIPLQYPKGSHNARSSIRRELTTADFNGIRREAPLKKFLPRPAISMVLSKEEASVLRAPPAAVAGPLDGSQHPEAG